MSTSDLLRGLQERAAWALPAEYTKKVEGWWLRHAPGCSWWAGTVLPHGDATSAELMNKVVAVEQFYAGHGAVTRFQITPGACPEQLDAILAERGYRRQSPMSLQVASTAHVLEGAPEGPLQVRLDDSPVQAWFDVWHTVHGHGGDSRPERDMLGRTERLCTYACALIGDDVVAVGRAVADAGWAGVFGMATLPKARGRGAARSVLAVLAEWAGAHGASRMYLQVEQDNAPARRLYERTGFGELCGYHYRTAG